MMVSLPSLVTIMLVCGTRLVKSCASEVNHTSFPPEYATPNLANFLAFLLGREWKDGSTEEWKVGT
jgi:hypothetical protein